MFAVKIRRQSEGKSRSRTFRSKFYWGGDLTVAGAGLLGRFVVQIGSGGANPIGEKKSCTVAIAEWRCETLLGGGVINWRIGLIK